MVLSKVERDENRPLFGCIALVTGASRGVGRGVAKELGRAGCTVYMTALRMQDEHPTVQSVKDKLPTLDSVANEVESLGGKAVPVYMNHDCSNQTAALFDKIGREQNGRLDILVNNAFGGVPLMMNHMHTKFWELPEAIYDQINNAGLKGHYWCARHAAKLMVHRRKGLIVNVGSYGGVAYTFNVAYGIGKAGIDRMSADMGIELKEFGVTCIGFYPALCRAELFSKEVGLLKNENVEDAYRDSESCEYTGKCIVALAKDPHLHDKTGCILTSVECGREYQIVDDDNRIPPNPRIFTKEHYDFIHNMNQIRTKIMI